MTEETTPKLLTDHERDVLDSRYHAGLLLKQGYYIGFEETGVPAVDRLLAALGWAGKAYHNTEAWGDADLDGYGPYTAEVSPSELIQRAANEAAQEMRSWKAEAMSHREEGA